LLLSLTCSNISLWGCKTSIIPYVVFGQLFVRGCSPQMIQMFRSLENLCKFLQIPTCSLSYSSSYMKDITSSSNCALFIVSRWLSIRFIPRGWRQNHHIPLVWTPEQRVLLSGPWSFNPYNQSHRHFPSWRTANTHISSTMGLASLTLHICENVNPVCVALTQLIML